MKTKLMILVALLFSVGVWGQTENDIEQMKVGSSIIFIAPASHTETVESPVILDTINKYPNYLEEGINFKIIEKKDSVYRITISPPFTKLKNKKEGEIDKSLYYNYKIFEVEEDEFKVKAILAPDIPDRFAVGILTLPFKFRPQDEKSFEPNFNLNTTLNILISPNWLQPTAIYAQIGAGIGSATLTQNTARGIGENEEINASTLTFLGGLMLQYKKVQAGIYFGVDQINNQQHYQWQHNGNIWLGFGIGYRLFSVGLGDKQGKNKNN